MTAWRYRILKKLGEGGSGRTYLVRDRKLGKLWAMKEWVEKEGAQEELRILRELESPCFPRIVECFQENGRQYLYFFVKIDTVRWLYVERIDFTKLLYAKKIRKKKPINRLISPAPVRMTVPRIRFCLAVMMYYLTGRLRFL